MEKHPHQEYRDELAEKLKDIRNSDPENPEIAKAKAEGYLDAKQESKEYEKAKEYITNQREEQFRKRLNESKLLEIQNELSEEADKVTSSIIKDVSDDIEVGEVDFSNDLRSLVYSMLELVRFVDLKKVNPDLKSSYYGAKLRDVLEIAEKFSGLEKVLIHPEFQNISRQILLQTLDVPRYDERVVPTSEISIQSTKAVQDRFAIPLPYTESSEFQDVLQKQLLSLAKGEIGLYSAEKGVGVLKNLIEAQLPISGEILNSPEFIAFVKERCKDFWRQGTLDFQSIRDTIENYFHFSESDIKDLGMYFIKNALSYYPVTSRGPAHTAQRAGELYSEYAIATAKKVASLWDISNDEMRDIINPVIDRIEEELKKDFFLAGFSKEGYLAIRDLLKRTYSV